MVRSCLLALSMVLALAAGPSLAQTKIVAVVNGEPITSYDVSQRSKLLRLTGQRGNLNEMAIDELINEAIQDLAVKQARITVSEAEIDAAIGDIATRAKISSAQLSGAFKQAGVSIDTLRDRIGSQIGFGRLVRARFNAQAQITEQDLVAALLKDSERETSVDSPIYDLHQVIIALPDDPSQQRLSRAQGVAADVRKRFSSCSQGLEMARKTRNVVVRPVGKRQGVEFPPQIREQLEKTPVGKLTEAIPQRRGLLMLAVCDKTIVRSTNAAMKALEPEMATERGEAFSKQYLRRLKRDAVIERRG